MKGWLSEGLPDHMGCVGWARRVLGLRLVFWVASARPEVAVGLRLGEIGLGQVWVRGLDDFG